MDIKEFVGLCTGKWFSQRTSFQAKVESSKAEITVEFLAAEHPECVKLCEQYQIQPNLALGGTKASWDSGDFGKNKQTGSTLLVWIPDDSANGRILRFLSQGQATAQGKYCLGTDEALTLSVGEADRQTEERVWFASPNLRLRTSLVKLSDGRTQMGFYSEIRKLAS
jgi:hypothetical protein